MSAGKLEMRVATIGAAALLAGAGITAAAQVIDDDPPESCSAVVERIDKLSPDTKAVYEAPGRARGGVVVSVEELRRCGDFELTLEQAARIREARERRAREQERREQQQKEQTRRRRP